MTSSENFALNQWLSDYPASMTYEGIIETLSDIDDGDTSDITVWEVAEDYPTDMVADFIENTKTAYERSLTFGEKT
tara:strand:+ start:1164 stop:1391 length:228 start_codon:yes stop_codon:yes gene_type:complete